MDIHNSRSRNHSRPARDSTLEPGSMRNGVPCHQASDGRESPHPVLDNNPRKEPNPVPTSFIVGDARANLDDIKLALLSYYGRLYSSDSRTITERLDALSSTFRQRSDTLGKKVPYVPPGDAYNFGAHTRQKPPLTSRVSSYEGCAAELNTVLTDLHRRCEAATYKLNALTGVFYPQIENPNLREWIYSTTPEVRRRPRTNSQDELRKHIISAYRHLHSQAELNQERINALQSKIKILYMHTKPQMMKLKEEPRVGL